MILKELVLENSTNESLAYLYFNHKSLAQKNSQWLYG